MGARAALEEGNRLEIYKKLKRVVRALQQYFYLIKYYVSTRALQREHIITLGECSCVATKIYIILR
jgi:hypothetical protein